MTITRRQMLTHFPTVTQSTGFQPEPLLTAHCSKLTAHSSLLLAQCGTGFQPKHLRWVMIQRKVRGTVLDPNSVCQGTCPSDPCGAGGDRTLVQTGNQYAFYMFISDFIVGQQQDLNHQLQPYPLKFHRGHEAFPTTIPDTPTPLYQTPRNKSF